MLKHYMANQCTKFEVSHFSHSGDILGGLCVILRLAVLIQYQSVTATHTQTHDDGIYRASIASCSNDKNFLRIKYSHQLVLKDQKL